MSYPFELLVFKAPLIFKLFEMLKVPIQEASLFAPLQQATVSSVSVGEVEDTLTAHGLWTDGAPNEEMRRILRVLGMPRKHYKVALHDHKQQVRFFSYGNGKDIVVAAFGKDEEVAVSRPLSFGQFLTGVLNHIGPNPNAKPGKDLNVLRFNRANFNLIHRLIDAGLPNEAQTFEALWPTVRDVYPEESQARLLFDALTEDGVLVAHETNYQFAPTFEGWVQALSSGEHMLVERMNLKGGKLSADGPHDRAWFFGPSGARFSVFQADDDTNDVLLCRPTAQDLRTLLGVLLGETDGSRLALNIPISPR